MMALDAWPRRPAPLGLTPLILGDALEGEAARGRHASWPASPAASAPTASRCAAPAVLLSGGETTVTHARQAPAAMAAATPTFLLGLAIALDGAPGIWAIAGDTDGIDGMEDVAGACRPRHAGARARRRPRRARTAWPPMTATACSTPSAT